MHTNYYEPYPFNLDFVVVDNIFFSWDELCDKCRVPEQKVGDYAIATTQGRPPAPVVSDLQAQQAEATASQASEAAAPKTTTPGPKGTGRGRKGKA